jgi:hypothetical protein
VISGNHTRLQDDQRKRLEVLTDNEKLIIVIEKTEPEVMKEVIIFLYTAQCDLNEHNGNNRNQ